MSIFYNIHDNPRMVSKICKDARYHKRLSKLLAVMQMTLKGTPFIFQGDEMGLVNYDFTSMDQITDVEAKGYYNEHIQTKSHEEVFNLLLAGTREHTRILLPWNKKLPSWHEGIKQNINEKVFDAYKHLIHLRQNTESLVYGEFKVINRKKDHFTYQRGNEILVDCNLSENSLKANDYGRQWKLIYPKVVDKNTMKPYEARIFKKI
jgi:oligo-1,6-glucosidase